MTLTGVCPGTAWAEASHSGPEPLISLQVLISHLAPALQVVSKLLSVHKLP